MQSSCEKLIDIFCEEEGDARYLSKRTVALYSNTLKQLVHWANARQLAIEMLDADQLEQFLIRQRQAHAKATSTFNLNITVLRLFYGFLLRRSIRKDNPARYLRFIKVARSMPPALKPIDIERLLNAPNVLTAQGIADRALLELLYATGLRIGELIGLELGDIFLGDVNSLQDCQPDLWPCGHLIVRANTSKSKSDRIIPFHGQCAYWLSCYISQVRCRLPNHRKHSNLFINRTCGGPLNRHSINRQIKRHAQSAKIDVRIYPHLLRHTFATHLLQGNAHLVAIAQLLGHSNLASTQIYTHITNSHLKAVHQEHHPRRAISHLKVDPSGC